MKVPVNPQAELGNIFYLIRDVVEDAIDGAGYVLSKYSEIRCVGVGKPCDEDEFLAFQQHYPKPFQVRWEDVTVADEVCCHCPIHCGRHAT